MDCMVGTCILIVVLLIHIVWKLWQKKSIIDRIPGPQGYPLIGNMFQIAKTSSHFQLTEWEKDYGNLYKISIMGTKVVVVSGERNVRDVLVHRSDDFAGRPFLSRVSLAHKGGFYISFGDLSNRWKRMKKIVIKSLGMFGGGLERLEDIVTEELQLLSDKLERKAMENTAFDIKTDIQAVMANIDFLLTCGRKMENVEFETFTETENKILSLISPGGKGFELEIMPWLKYIPYSTVSALTEIEKMNATIFEPVIKERKEVLRTEQTCVLDSLLLCNECNSSQEKFPAIDMRAIVEDLCTAGISTTASVVYSFIARCVANPSFQEQLQEEIDEQLGGRWPQLSDRIKTPFLLASIYELFRYVTPVPVAVPHKTTKDVELGGYTVPKDTEVLVNLWSLHHDPICWEKPWDFKPSRFLNEDGTLVGPEHPNRKRLLPFGAGRRVCAGETMAKGRIYLTLATLLQRYTFSPADQDGPLPITDPRQFESGIVLYAPCFKLRVNSRNQ